MARSASRVRRLSTDALLLVILAFGPGRFSLDHLVGDHLLGDHLLGWRRG